MVLARARGEDDLYFSYGTAVMAWLVDCCLPGSESMSGSPQSARIGGKKKKKLEDRDGSRNFKENNSSLPFPQGRSFDKNCQWRQGHVIAAADVLRHHKRSLRTQRRWKQQIASDSPTATSPVK